MVDPAISRNPRRAHAQTRESPRPTRVTVVAHRVHFIAAYAFF
jgi:hypothetical protein